VFDAFPQLRGSIHQHYQFFLKARMDGLMGKVKIERGDLRVQKRMTASCSPNGNPTRSSILPPCPAPKGIDDVPDRGVADQRRRHAPSLLEGVKASGSVTRFIFYQFPVSFTATLRRPLPTRTSHRPIDVYGGHKLTGEI